MSNLPSSQRLRVNNARKVFQYWLANKSSSWWCMMAALAGFTSFAAALGLQHMMGLQPCPLCIFQRVAVLGSSVVLFGASILLYKKRVQAIPCLVLGASLATGGLAIAIKHMYVMWVPQDVSCGPDLEYLIEAFPLTKWLPKVFAGEAECAAAAGQLVLGLPIPVWSAILFLLQIAISWYAWRRRHNTIT